MINEALDEFSVNMYAQKTMALATQVQTGSLVGEAAVRGMHDVAEDALAHFRGWKHANPAETRELLVDCLRRFSLRVPASQPHFAEVLVAVADLIEAGSLDSPPAAD
jgi:hypothetical protein